MPKLPEKPVGMSPSDVKRLVEGGEFEVDFTGCREDVEGFIKEFAVCGYDAEIVGVTEIVEVEAGVGPFLVIWEDGTPYTVSDLCDKVLEAWRDGCCTVVEQGPKGFRFLTGHEDGEVTWVAAPGLT